MTATDTRTVEERLAALEAALTVPASVSCPEGWTPEQVAGFQKAWDSGDWRKHQVRWLPPAPLLTPELARALLRECVTVVKPGEMLVIRVPESWTPNQVQEYQRWLHGLAEDHGIRACAVVGEELGVAESGPDAHQA